jgi:di/tricarboxylate transporter
MEYGILLIALMVVVVFAYAYYVYHTITKTTEEVIVWVDVPSPFWGPALNSEWIDIVAQHGQEE